MIKTADVVNEYIMARKQGYPKVAERMRRLIISGLSPQQMRVWRMLPLFENEDAHTGQYFAEKMGIKINHADNILNRLHELGLAEKYEVVDKRGRRFVWRERLLGLDVNEAERVEAA